MTSVTVTARAGEPQETDADTRVVGLFEGESLGDPTLQALVESGEAKPALRKVAVAHEDHGGKPRRVIVAGLGKPEELDAEKARVAAAAVAGRARELGTRALWWAAPRITVLGIGLIVSCGSWAANDSGGVLPLRPL